MTAGFREQEKRRDPSSPGCRGRWTRPHAAPGPWESQTREGVELLGRKPPQGQAHPHPLPVSAGDSPAHGPARGLSPTFTQGNRGRVLGVTCSPGGGACTQCGVLTWGTPADACTTSQEEPGLGRWKPGGLWEGCTPSLTRRHFRNKSSWPGSQ